MLNQEFILYFVGKRPMHHVLLLFLRKILDRKGNLWYRNKYEKIRESLVLWRSGVNILKSNFPVSLFMMRLICG